MLKEPLKDYAKREEFQISNDIAYKNIEGFIVSLNEESTYKRINISISIITDEAIEKHIKDFGENLIMKYHISKYRVNDNNIEICFQNDGNEKTIQRMHAFLKVFIPKLKELGIKGINECFYCHKPNDGTSSVYYLDGNVLLAHEQCMKHHNENNNINTRKYYDNGSILSGFFGSLWGALIGALPLFLTTLIGHPIFVLAIIIGFLARYYYDIWDGYKSYIVKFVCCCVWSVIMAFLAFYLVTIPEHTEFAVDINLILSMVFAAAGSFIKLKVKRRNHYPKDRMKKLS